MIGSFNYHINFPKIKSRRSKKYSTQARTKLKSIKYFRIALPVPNVFNFLFTDPLITF